MTTRSDVKNTQVGAETETNKGNVKYTELKERLTKVAKTLKKLGDEVNDATTNDVALTFFLNAEVYDLTNKEGKKEILSSQFISGFKSNNIADKSSGVEYDLIRELAVVVYNATGKIKDGGELFGFIELCVNNFKEHLLGLFVNRVNDLETGQAEFVQEGFKFLVQNLAKKLEIESEEEEGKR